MTRDVHFTTVSLGAFQLCGMQPRDIGHSQLDKEIDSKPGAIAYYL